MDTAVGAAALEGAALGGVLALAGAWSRLIRGRALPHLGVGALAGVLALGALRWAGAPVLIVLVGVALLGAVLATAAALLDARARVKAPRSLLADVSVLAMLLVLGAVLRPAVAVPLPFGPLGGQPGALSAVGACLLGVGGALLLGSAAVAGLAPWARWAVAGAVLGVTVTLATGALSPTSLAFGGFVGLPDTAGLALRAVAVGLAARRGAPDAIAAGIVLGVGERVLAMLVPLGGAALLPAATALAIGLAVHVRERSAVRA